MTRLIPSIVILATSLTGCSYTEEYDIDQYIPEVFRDNSIIHRPLIQQGNIVRQEELNKIRLGMSKRQVQFVLGTPMVQDMFHTDRWDYAFQLNRGNKQLESQHLRFQFENDELVDIIGKSQPGGEVEQVNSKDAIYDVPDWVPENPGIFERLKRTVGLSDEVD